MPRISLSARRGLLTAAALFFLSGVSLAQSDDPGILAIGDAAVTGFSGVAQPDPQEPPLTPAQILDETFINPDAVSARINALNAPGFVWDARVWPANGTMEFAAHDIGQVFGVTIDDADKPSIYFAASSAYGLHIVKPDEDGDGRPERLKQGDAAALWMEGMWGKGDTKGAPGSKGGPGSIWKADGRTGEVTLFANVTLDGAENAGAGLGNITYVPALKQLFASDLSTGMIHRFAMDGSEVETFDHGVTGRSSAELKPVAFDPDARLDITSPDFDPEDSDTWGMTDEDRRVHALAFHDGRLYYAVAGGSQIWSVGFDKDTGKFLPAAQWELDVPEKPKALPVTDMLFTRKGAMVLAQRGAPTSTYDYAGLAAHGKSRVYRYWLESPQDDPATPSRWIAEPEEYAVGFEISNRQTSGGLALNHGYTKSGYLDTSVCEASLWTTGDDLHQSDAAELAAALTPGGPLLIDGLQGMPAGPVKQYEKGSNTPPWASYMLDNDPGNTDVAGDPLLFSDALTQGWTGDVEILRTDCDAVAGGGTGYWGGAGYEWSTPDYVFTDGDGDGDGDPKCTPGVDCPAGAVRRSLLASSSATPRPEPGPTRWIWAPHPASTPTRSRSPEPRRASASRAGRSSRRDRH